MELLITQIMDERDLAELIRLWNKQVRVRKENSS